MTKRKSVWYVFDYFHGKKHTFSTKNAATSFKMKQRKEGNCAITIRTGWKKLKKVI